MGENEGTIPGADGRWLPVSGWLSVDAGTSGAEITALLSAETVPQNIRMLRETRAFARLGSRDGSE
jgi:hypothetical protein